MIFSSNRAYAGPVAFADGWHWSVKNGRPHRKLFLDDDGSFRFARRGDASWNGRTHQQTVNLMAGGQ